MISLKECFVPHQFWAHEMPLGLILTGLMQLNAYDWTSNESIKVVLIGWKENPQHNRGQCSEISVLKGCISVLSFKSVDLLGLWKRHTN